MSKVFNMVGGGGKNISSIIISGLSRTDTVTCTKGGKSYTATWDETAQHWEIVGLPLGTFTVTATNGTITTTETVLIDIAGVYEIEMDYKLWLYKDGNEFDDVTGGWGAISVTTFGAYSLRNNSLQITKTDNCISLSFSTVDKTCFCAFGTAKNVNVGNYSKACFEVQAPNGNGDATYIDIGLKSDSIQSHFLPTQSVGPARVVSGGVSSVVTKSVHTIDISQMDCDAIAAVEMTNNTTNGSMSINIYKVWLE